MLVKDLIKKLSDCDPNAQVVTSHLSHYEDLLGTIGKIKDYVIHLENYASTLEDLYGDADLVTLDGYDPDSEQVKRVMHAYPLSGHDRDDLVYIY